MLPLGATNLRQPIKTALHQSVLEERLHQIRLLVKHGVNVNRKDIYGRTPLMVTCFLDNENTGWKMARILIHAGASLGIKDNLGRTALSYACTCRRSSIVKLILRDESLDIKAIDNDGNCSLHHASASGSPETVEMLVDAYLKLHLDVDSRNNLGYTSLLLACKQGNFVSAHILLTKGNASPDLKDNEGFFSAAEWIYRYQNRMEIQPAPRAKTLLPRFLPDLPGVSRLYQDERRRTSRLPGMANSRQAKGETLIEGRDARQKVLHEIAKSGDQLRPASTRSDKTATSLSTERLLNVGAIRTGKFPSITALFKIYSDQQLVKKQVAHLKEIPDTPSLKDGDTTERIIPIITITS